MNTEIIDSVLNAELDDVVVDTLIHSSKKIENKIKFDTVFNRPNNFVPQKIGFDEVNSYDFSKGFTEYLISEEYVHLYFDFDSIESEDEFLDVWNWLDELKKTFGSYSMGGYCDNDEMEGYGFRRYDEGNHYLSMHVVYYETRIATVDLQKIMKHTEKKGFSTKGVNKLCDPNVYKLVSKKEGQTIRQLFRHVLADKIYRIGDEKNKMNHGFILNGMKPDTQIVQVRGDERIIGQNEWRNHFTIKEKEDVRNEKQSDDIMKNIALLMNDDDLEARNELIVLNETDMMDLLKNLEPTYDNFINIVSNVMHSPYEQEVVKEWIEKWYFMGEHQNQNTIELYVDKYYEKVNSNKWFWSIIKHLDEGKRNEWRKRFVDVGIDEEAKINMKEEFTLRNLREKEYRKSEGVGHGPLASASGVKVNEFISDLKKCVAVINTAPMVFVVKDYDAIRNTSTLSFLNYKEFKEVMKSINVGVYVKSGKKKTVNAFMIYEEGKNKNYLLKDGIKFYDERENMFSYFIGYDYNELDEVKEEVIQPFLNHVKEVIANNNEEVYEYIMNWYAYILQKPNAKTETAIVITGRQGTGKNVFTNVLCELMARYANKNLTNIDELIGQFNTASENMKLIICNELSSAETNKYLNSDSLKSVITESTVNVNPKNKAVHLAENVVNLILVSNNAAPIKIEVDDRRYVVTETSNKYKGDFKYFEKLCGSFNREFYNNLFNYFMKRDVKGFNPRKIPVTEAKKNIVEASKTSYELFIQEYIDEFIDGFVCSNAFSKYQKWCKDNGFVACSVKTFGSNVKQYCIKKRASYEGRPLIYLLRDDAKQYFDMNDEKNEDMKRLVNDNIEAGKEEEEYI